ncbi:hypothetical protein M9720_001363 [Escherichia coli]|nr:hypothetical protein [Escherichia coli]EJG4456180.1 hypothetical protein [Escherichia coli]
MTTYPFNLTLPTHGKEAEKILYDYLDKNHSDITLKKILDIDLDFIDSRAQSTDYFIIDDIEYLDENIYVLHYSISYFIYNMCKDMDIDDSYSTTVTFEVNDGLLEFNVIDKKRSTLDEF